jgi:hypothetical protein
MVVGGIDMKKSLFISSFLLAGCLVMGQSDSHAGGFARGHSVHTNGAGGVSGKFAAGVKGPNGGMAGHTRGFATDGQGNAVGGSAAAFKTPGGAKGFRAGMTTRSADGTVRRQSGGAVSGVNGTASSYGGFTKNADGTTSGSRSTTVQSKNSEASYQGNTSYSSTDGLQHTSTCADAEGDLGTCSAVK